MSVGNYFSVSVELFANYFGVVLGELLSTNTVDGSVDRKSDNTGFSIVDQFDDRDGGFPADEFDTLTFPVTVVLSPTSFLTLLESFLVSDTIDVIQPEIGVVTSMTTGEGTYGKTSHEFQASYLGVNFIESVVTNSSFLPVIGDF